MNEHSQILEREKLDIDDAARRRSAAAGGVAARAVSDRAGHAGRAPADPRRRPARDAAGRPPARPRADQIHRRLELPRHALCAHQARRHRLGPHQAHRHQRGGSHARRDGGAHRQGNPDQFLRPDVPGPAGAGRRCRVPRRRRRRRGGGGHRADRQRGAGQDRGRIRAAAGRARSGRRHARGFAQGACARQQHLRDQGDPQRRRREGLRRVRPYLRGPLLDADDRARLARAARGHRRLGRQWPPHDLRHASAASRWRAPTWRAR